MAGVQQSVLFRFAWLEPWWSTTLLDDLDSFESLMKIIIDKKASCHDCIIVDLADHAHELGLQLGQCAMQIIQDWAFLARLHLVNDLVGEVDVALDQVHVGHQLFKLGRRGVRTLRVCV